jgi:hypothetical protein
VASVSNVELEMGRDSDDARLEFARVTFGVSFTPAEVRLGLRYEIHLLIVERDGALDDFILTPNGFRGHPYIRIPLGWPPELTRLRQGNRDEVVFYYRQSPRPDAEDEWIVDPANGDVQEISRRFTFDVGDQERGEDEYVAIVWVIPELYSGHGHSGTARVSLG